MKTKTIRLVGHSGCTLEVHERGGGLVVLKTATEKDYGNRLKKQHQKQRDFKHAVFKAPTVLGIHEDEHGMFGFSMEYINGVTLAEYFSDARVSSLRALADKFLSLVPKARQFDPKAPMIFKKKIRDLRSKLNVPENPRVKRALALLNEYDWVHCSRGECHGDLSLENIIWKDGELYLIDFLDSFYDSWMMDLAKLLFDVETLWSYRNSKNSDENLKIRLAVFKKILLESILARPGGEKIVRSIYHMALLHLVRILPYTIDLKTEEYLLEEMSQLCDSIETI